MFPILIRRAWPILNHPWLFWAALALPGLWLLWLGHVRGVPDGRLVFETGLISVWFLFAAFAITPLAWGLRRVSGPAARWLVSRRRYVGVAGFAYAALHAWYYVRGLDAAAIAESFATVSLLLGWLALAILAAMAATSNNAMVRRLRAGWKALQRWIYLAIPLALAHGYMVEFSWHDVYLYAGVFGLGMGVRALRWRRRAAASG
jgi:methionine sulfoxide reductase heme-binding subunit